MINIHKGNDLVALSSSILKRFGVTPNHPTLKEADELFKKHKDKHIVLFLFDGMGRNIYETYKKELKFIYPHIYHPFYSIYPPTTVAATNAILTDQYPLENGFVGWNQYFKEEDNFIDVFMNKDKNKKDTINVIDTYLKPKFIFDLINEKAGSEISVNIKSLDYRNKDRSQNFNRFFSEVDKACKQKEFIYAYCSEPDHSMHPHGIKHWRIKKKIKYLDRKMKEIVKNNKDVLFLLISDHGFIDVEDIDLRKDKELVESIKSFSKEKNSLVTVEGRFASFFVDDKEKFLDNYNKKYKDYFELYTKEEILSNEILGPKMDIKNINKNALDTLGDFILIAKDKYIFQDNFEEGGEPFKGAHAGMTKEEMEIYLTVFNGF